MGSTGKKTGHHAVIATAKSQKLRTKFLGAKNEVINQDIKYNATKQSRYIYSKFEKNEFWFIALITSFEFERIVEGLSSLPTQAAPKH